LSLIQALILGIIQGVTEFLPISSSGHLVLAPWLLGWQIDNEQAFIFDVLVQWGTIMAVIIYFRDDLWQLLLAGVRSLRGETTWKDPLTRRAWLIIAASLPAAILGLLLKSTVELAFSSPLAVALFLMGTATLLILSEQLGKLDRSLDALNWFDAIWIGFFQAMALFPGISRSGSTIAGGLLRGLNREQAARFSNDAWRRVHRLARSGADAKCYGSDRSTAHRLYRRCDRRAYRHPLVPLVLAYSETLWLRTLLCAG
jgi:undecaprenyl-diphosphatase